MKNSAVFSDYVAMGLAHYKPFQSAFKAAPPKGVEKPCTAPKKRGPTLTKLQKSVIALETAEERAARLAGAKRALDQKGRAIVDLAPRTTGAITIHSKADTDRSARIRRGRSI